MKKILVVGSGWWVVGGYAKDHSHRRHLLSIFLLLATHHTLLTTHRLYAAKMKGDDLSNMIIEGENRLVVHAVLPEMEWKPDPFKDVAVFVKDYSAAGMLNPPAVADPPLMLPLKSATEKTATPWFNRILEPPVLTLALKPPKDKRKVQCTFLIKDSAGKTFYESKTSGDLPKEMIWDGFGDQGAPLKMGYDYSYSYSILDEAGIPHRFSGHPFRLEAFRYARARDTVMAFSSESIFENRSSFKFSRDGIGYLTEIKDYVRSHFDKSLEVKTFDTDEKFAVARSKVIHDFIVKNLDFPEDKVTSTGLSSAGGEYRRVEIIVK